MTTNTPAQDTPLSSKPMYSTVTQVLSRMGPIKWLVKNLIEQDATSVLFAPPGEGKSFFALDVACCVATGALWHGERVAQGPVIYIAGEGHGGLARRFAAWQLHNQVSLADAPLYVSRMPISFFDEEEAGRAAKEALAVCPPGQKPALVIIDTVARSFAGGDENSAQDMVKFLNAVDRLTRLAWGCHTMLVHHTGHDASRERGSSALGGNMDQRFQIKKSAGGHRTLICQKMKDAELPKDRSFELKSVFLGEHVDNFGDVTQVTSAVPRLLTEVETPITGSSEKVAFNIASLVDLMVDGWPGVETIRTHFGVSKTTVQKGLLDAMSQGLIEQNGRGYKISYRGRQQNVRGPGGLGLQ